MTVVTRAAWIAAVCFIAGSARAATLTVCASGCQYTTIQSAVDAAAAGDVIDVGVGTYAGDVDVSVADLTIRGAGAGATFVDAFGFASFIFRSAAGSVALSGVTLRSLVGMSCLYNYGASLTIEDSTLTGCQANYQVGESYVGGAIYTIGDLVLRRVTVADNTAPASTNGLGGGLYIGLDPFFVMPAPVVRIYASTFTGNTALVGGAIYAEAGTQLFVDGTTLTGNTASNAGFPCDQIGEGGAIYSAGELYLTSSTVGDNFADATGGGVALTGIEDSWIANTVFRGNSVPRSGIFAPTYTGGGLYLGTYGTVTVTSSLFEGNSAGFGGGVGSYNLSSGGAYKITGSTFSANTALWGGGMAAMGAKRFVLNRATVTGNTATEHGGGMAAVLSADIELRDSTVSRNTSLESAGGLYTSGGGVTLRNTIVAGNTAPVPSGARPTHDCDATLASEDYNLIGATSGCIWAPKLHDVGGIGVPIDPLLSLLGYYGGITPTLLPKKTSPVIDTGGLCFSRDQSGNSRPVDGGTGVANCDRGAVEVGGTCAAPVVPVALEPPSGVSVLTPPAVLTWEPAFGAVSYTVGVSTSPGIIGGIIDIASGTATHWAPTVVFAPNTTYYWQVTAVSNCGKLAVTPIFSFTTAP